MVVELLLMLGFMIAAAIVAVETKDLLSSVIALGAVGFGVTIVFLLLQAPDLAIVQVVVEILAVVFLIAVVLRTTRVDTTRAEQIERTDIFPVALTMAFVLAFILLSVRAFNTLPEFGSPLRRVAQYYVAQGLGRTGAANLVASVILDFRAYDTLGEATVLFTSVISVVAILRRVGRKRSETGEG